MKLKALIPIIAIVSVAAMIIWSTISGDWSKSWLCPFVGGIAITILSIIIHAGEKKDK